MSTTVNAGTTGSFTFVTNDSLLVTLDPGEVASVIVTSAAGQVKYQAEHRVTKIVGPFIPTDVLKITAVKGNVDYDIVDQEAFGSPAYTGGAADPVDLGGSGVTGLLPFNKLAVSGTPAGDGTKFVNEAGALVVPAGAAAPFSTTLFSGTSGNGSAFTYPGSGASNFDISSTNWNGAVATIQRSTDGGSTWNAVSGDLSSFSANGGCELSETLNVKVRVSVTGTAGATITATLGR